MKTDLLEELCKLEHERWVHWIKYMLDNLTEEDTERCRRRIETPYSELSEEETEPYRNWATRVLGTCWGEMLPSVKTIIINDKLVIKYNDNIDIVEIAIGVYEVMGVESERDNTTFATLKSAVAFIEANHD